MAHHGGGEVERGGPPSASVISRRSLVLLCLVPKSLTTRSGRAISFRCLLRRDEAFGVVDTAAKCGGRAKAATHLGEKYAVGSFSIYKWKDDAQVHTRLVSLLLLVGVGSTVWSEVSKRRNKALAADSMNLHRRQNIHR